MSLLALQEPFAPGELSWRVLRAGRGDRGIWAMCAPYVDSRVIMKRLDDVCGIGGWQSRTQMTDGHVACGLAVQVDGEWVWRWDGAGRLETNPKLSAADAGKGDFTNAFKRSAAQFGIARYLHDVRELHAIVQDGGRYRASYRDKEKKAHWFNWDPPALPASALPTKVPPVVSDMRILLEQAASLGLGGDDDQKTANAIRLVERGIEAHDVKALHRARPWLESEVDRLTPAEGAA